MARNLINYWNFRFKRLCDDSIYRIKVISNWKNNIFERQRGYTFVKV